MKFFSWLIAFIVGITLSVQGAVQDSSFLQEAVTRYTWEELGTPPILQAELDSQNHLWLLASDSLWLLENGKVKRMDQNLGLTILPGTRIRSNPKQPGALMVANPNGVYRYAPDSKTAFVEIPLGPVRDAAVTVTGQVWIATDKGLLTLTSVGDEYEWISEMQEPTAAICVTENTVPNLAAGTAKILYFIDQKASGFRWEYVHGLIDRPITALAFAADGTLWIGNSDCINLRTDEGAFKRIGGMEGLPYNRILCLEPGWDNDMWIGTEKGACRFHNLQWSYYYGPRWHWGDRIISIVAQKPNLVWLVADKGLSRIEFQSWTLSKKADHYESMVRPRHDRFGLTADCTLQKFGDLTSYQQHDTDNDGLWTSIYLAAECFRYAVTKSPDAKTNAWRSFAAMEKLEQLTGVPGFFARTYVKKGEAHEQGGEWHDSADGEWTWKGDTSSDELVGHMFAYPLVYDLLAETPQEQQRVRQLVSRIMNYVVDHGYYLMDLDGKPTTWGVWAPEKLNDDSKWCVERGLNSLQILSFLSAAHHITGEEKFLNAFNELVKKHGYARNLINQKIEIPLEVNHSDDELAFLPYYILFRYTKDHPLRKTFQLSMDRSWGIEKPEKSSLWNLIYASTDISQNQLPMILADAVWTLQEWPLELIDWPTPNSHRLDIRLHPSLERFGRKQTVDVLPPDERRIMRWNGNPFELDGGGGYAEDDPGAWLLPYWMARYHGWIEN